MAVAIPFIGAAVGWLAGGTAMWAQVGWMVGSMIYSAVQPTPTQSAGNPSSAPSVGSDIRGQNIPVIFGTVRCSGYLVWQANFTSTKNTQRVGSGKKKSNQEYYSYSWDFMFHMGHATVPYRLVGVWEGSERIQDDSLDNVTFADGSVFFPAAKSEQQETLLSVAASDFWNFATGVSRYRQLQSTQAAKSLAWSEAYFYGAHATASALNGWAYFQSQEAAPDLRWPSSVWLGFKQFQLGQQPRIPQLNFEVTPDQEPTQQSAYDGTVISQEWVEANAPGNSRQRTPTGITVGGNQIVFTTADTDTLFYVKSTRSSAEKSYSKTEAVAAQAAVGNTHTERMNDLEYVGCWMLPGTNDLVMVHAGAEPLGPSNEQFIMFSVFEIGEDATITAIGYSYDAFNLPLRWTGGIHSMCLNENQSTIYAFGSMAVSANTVMYVTPYPRTNNRVVEDQITINDLSVNLFDNFLFEGTTYQNRNANNDTAGFLVPMASGSVRFYFLLTKVRAQFAIDNVTSDDVIEGLAPTNPNGGMFYIEMSSSGAYVSGPTLCNASFDQNGPPFDNDSENNDGSAIAQSEGQGYTDLMYAGPANIGVANSDWVVCFMRDVSSQSSNSATGSFASYRTFEFDVTTGLFVQASTEVGYQMEDTVQAYNQVAGDRYTGLDYKDMSVLYAPISGELFRAGQKGDGVRVFDIVVRVGRVRAGIIDLTPPEIIKAIFCDPVIGFGKSETLIDTTTYNAAVTYCEENGVKISVVYPSASERISIFEALVNVYGGWVAWDGYKLKFGRPTEVFSAVRVIDNDYYYQESPDDPKPPFTGRRQALQDTSNKITVKFYDRLLSYRQNEVTLGDEVDQDINGVRHKQLTTGFIMSRGAAYRLCERMLWGNMYARNIYSDVMLGWKGSRFEPGDPITLVDSFSNTNVSARLVKKEEVKRGVFKCTFIEELDYLGKSKALIEQAKPGVRGLPTTTERPLDFDAYELSYEFQREGPKYYVGWAPGGPSASAGLYTSTSTTDFRLYGSALPYPDSGRILSYFPPAEGVLTNVRVLVNAKSGTSVTSIPTWFEGELEDFNSFDRAQGLSNFRVGSELMAYEGATIVGSNTYVLDRVYRGYGGTQIQAHSPGDVWWLHNPNAGGGIFSVPYQANQIGTSFFYKVVPVGFDGVEYDPSSITYKQYAINGQHFTPQAVDASDIRVLVGSTSAIPNSLANLPGLLEGTSLQLISPNYTRLVGSSAERNFTIQWPETSKDSGMGAKGYGTQPYGDFTKDLDTVSWLVSVVGSGNNVVRSVTVTTPGYLYDALANVADNGAWRGVLGISILPKNGYGNSPFSAVVSLNISQ